MAPHSPKRAAKEMERCVTSYASTAS
jgi:hypothetical protein